MTIETFDQSDKVDSIAVSVFVVILVEFDKYLRRAGLSMMRRHDRTNKKDKERDKDNDRTPRKHDLRDLRPLRHQSHF